MDSIHISRDGSNGDRLALPFKQNILAVNLRRANEDECKYSPGNLVYITLHRNKNTIQFPSCYSIRAEFHENNTFTVCEIVTYSLRDAAVEAVS